MAKRPVAALAALVLAIGLLAGCAMTTSGHAVSIYDNPFQVAGLPSTSGPSGPRPGATDAQLAATGGDKGLVDTMALNAIADIQSFWREEYHTEFDGEFKPVTKFYSWDAKAPRSRGTRFCDDTTYQLVNAAYCRLDNSVGWDRGVLLPSMQDSFGKMAVVMVLAHEYGHAVQTMSHLVSGEDPVIVKEQQADCFAGAFMRHVAEDKAEHFTINTSDGLNNVLAATVAIRDADPEDPESVHGSAFERVTAVQIGFTDGPKGCKAIDMKDIESRRKNLPQSFGDDVNRGELAITKDSLKELSKAMAAIMPIPSEPSYDYHGALLHCRNGADTVPVTYCPATNTIGTDIPALIQRGAANTDDQEGFPTRVGGDYNAYVVFVSRYTLAVQRGARQQLTGAKTGLRAACLSGVITAKLADPNRGAQDGDIALSPGDLDKAVSGLLSDGLAASDVEGKTVPSGFSRVDAFRAGVLGTQQTCESRYS
ncbi:metallopeptidase [Nocardia vermiculata]|uniref:Metallopeptidase n=1 Tax=Nocardia vermiculata TaxID=257274 RepID=A0A846XZG7_9NOCA|nr:metallopeptidase [Nocardia vermiculata]NKY50438.1 metallopeptidase [Nocardia vermiculata]